MGLNEDGNSNNSPARKKGLINTPHPYPYPKLSSYPHCSVLLHVAQSVHVKYLGNQANEDLPVALFVWYNLQQSTSGLFTNHLKWSKLCEEICCANSGHLIFTPAQSNGHTHTHTHICIWYTHKHMCTKMHAGSVTHTHTHTHAQLYTKMHAGSVTHTHTGTQSEFIWTPLAHMHAYTQTG